MISYAMGAESKVPAFHHTAMIAISACVLIPRITLLAHTVANIHATRSVHLKPGKPLMKSELL